MFGCTRKMEKKKLDFEHVASLAQNRFFLKSKFGCVIC